MSTPEENEITGTLDHLKRAQAGDRAGFDALFDSVEARLLLYIRMRYRTPGQVGAREDVEDILQRTYIEALRAFSTFEYRGSGSFYRWMREIARLAIARTFDVHRKAKCRSADREVSLSALAPDDAQDVIADSPRHQPTSPSRKIHRDEKLQALARALEGIPEHYREVVVLHKLEEKPFAETAQLMGRTEAACKMIYFRAMGELRKRLLADKAMVDASEIL